MYSGLRGLPVLEKLEGSLCSAASLINEVDVFASRGDAGVESLAARAEGVAERARGAEAKLIALRAHRYTLESAIESVRMRVSAAAPDGALGSVAAAERMRARLLQHSDACVAFAHTRVDAADALILAAYARVDALRFAATKRRARVKVESAALANIRDSLVSELRLASRAACVRDETVAAIDASAAQEAVAVGAARAEAVAVAAALRVTAARRAAAVSATTGAPPPSAAPASALIPATASVNIGTLTLEEERAVRDDIARSDSEILGLERSAREAHTATRQLAAVLGALAEGMGGGAGDQDASLSMLVTRVNAEEAFATEAVARIAAAKTDAAEAAKAGASARLAHARAVEHLASAARARAKATGAAVRAAVAGAEETAAHARSRAGVARTAASLATRAVYRTALGLGATAASVISPRVSSAALACTLESTHLAAAKIVALGGTVLRVTSLRGAATDALFYIAESAAASAAGGGASATVTDNSAVLVHPFMRARNALQERGRRQRERERKRAPPPAAVPRSTPLQPRDGGVETVPCDDGYADCAVADMGTEPENPEEGCE